MEPSSIGAARKTYLHPDVVRVIVDHARIVPEGEKTAVSHARQLRTSTALHRQETGQTMEPLELHELPTIALHELGEDTIVLQILVSARHGPQRLGRARASPM